MHVREVILTSANLDAQQTYKKITNYLQDVHFMFFTGIQIQTSNSRALFKPTEDFIMKALLTHARLAVLYICIDTFYKKSVQYVYPCPISSNMVYVS